MISCCHAGAACSINDTSTTRFPNRTSSPQANGNERNAVTAPKRAHLRVLASNTTKIQREDTQIDTKKSEMVAGEGKKRAKFWAVRRRGGPVEEEVRRKVVQGSPNQQQHNNNTTTTKQHNNTTQNNTNNNNNTRKFGQNTKTLKLAKVGLAKVGQDHDWPKSVKKLAKVGHDQCRRMKRQRCMSKNSIYSCQ